MAIAVIGNVEIVVRTRDEHCPPHIHADCRADGWSARFKFHFTSDEVEYWDIKPKGPRKPPSRSALVSIGEAVYGNLAVIRERWWQALGDVCLKNRYIDESKPGLVFLDDHRPVPSAVQIRSVTYDPTTGELAVTLNDGATRRVVSA
jgi:hypothetical protein